MGLFQIAEEEAAETARQDLDRQKEAWTAGDPTTAVRRDSPAGHDTMQMGMEIEGLSPRVQDTEKADLCPQVIRVCRNRLQGIGGRSKQQIVDLAFVLESQRGQFCR